jgi:hypothetical protein
MKASLVFSLLLAFALPATSATSRVVYDLGHGQTRSSRRCRSSQRPPEDIEKRIAGSRFGDINGRVQSRSLNAAHRASRPIWRERNSLLSPIVGLAAEV